MQLPSNLWSPGELETVESPGTSNGPRVQPPVQAGKVMTEKEAWGWLSKLWETPRTRG